jgi:hypothetical protein
VSTQRPDSQALPSYTYSAVYLQAMDYSRLLSHQGVIGLSRIGGVLKLLLCLLLYHKLLMLWLHHPEDSGESTSANSTVVEIPICIISF